MRRTLLLFSLSSVLFGGSLQGQVLFYEDFDQIPGPTAGGPGTYVFPSGWLLRNVDNQTVDPNGPTYVNDAWERREDFNFSVIDSAAFSTSWYAPPGVANDWMWTPLIGPLPANVRLSWNGVAYDPNFRDGYEVRIMTQSSTPTGPTGGAGTIGNQITNSTVLSTIAAENSAWTPHNVNLNAYAGQSVWIGFRNNSNDKFLLLIDDIKLEVILNYEGQVVSLDTITEYTNIPVSQVSPLPLGGQIRNNGLLSLTNAVLNVRIFDGTMTQIHSSGSTPMTLTAGQTANVTAGTWTPPTTAGTYTVQYYISATEGDQLPGNDTLYTTVTISDTIYSRDSRIPNGSVGIGAGNGYLGQEFLITNPCRLTGVETFLAQGYTGRRYALVVWNMSATVPTTILAGTDTLLYPDDSARFYVMPMHNGPVNLNPGRYAFTMVEFDSTLAIGLTNDIFTPNRTWVSWSTQAWTNNEDIGPNFAKSYMIRPIIKETCPAQIIQDSAVTSASCNMADGTATVNTVGLGPFEYHWSTGGSSATETGLAAGSYTVTVTHINSGCSETISVSVTNPGAPSATVTSVDDVTCFGLNNGAATINTTGGTPSYTYSWAPSGGTGASASNLAAGSYTVTVTDAANCVTITSLAITEPTQLTASVTASTPETCVGCNDGSATVTANGGTTGYTYSWSPSGGTGATASGLAAGNYTVTVTDNNGCTTTATVTVGSTAGVEDPSANDDVRIYPNPNDGSFMLETNIPYSGAAVIDIVDVSGRVVYTRTIQVNSTLVAQTTRIEGVSAGTYMLRFTAGNSQFLRKLVVQ